MVLSSLAASAQSSNRPTRPQQGATSQSQVAAPTAEQLQMLQQLPEGQRQELMRALGITGMDQQRLQQPASPEYLPQEAMRARRLGSETPTGPPVLEAGSTVVVKLLLPKIESAISGADSGILSQQSQQQSQRPEPSSQPFPEPSLRPEDQDLTELKQLAELETRGRVDPDIERIFNDRVLRNPQLGQVLGARTYVLDREGRLVFPGVATVPLAGLTEFSAARRIEAEPNLRPLVASVLLLPLQTFGADALEPFGYRLFEDAFVSFAPATDVPVPPDYLLGPGDEIRVQFFGTQNASFSLVVDRDGSLSLPEIGPIGVAGLTFGEARELIEHEVSQKMIGVDAAISMGALRSIRVFVLGDVAQPGSFTVSGLSTIMNALFVSGGVTPAGSLRRVELKRGGRTVQVLDVYDLLLRGDSRADVRLQSNDVLFVPPRGPTVAVAGEVQRPAIYEFVGKQTLDDMIQLAGGLTSMAYSRAVRVERVDQTGGRSVLSFDVTSPAGRDAVVRHGDHVTVDTVPVDVLTDHVTLEGHVHRPGPYQWRPGMRLSDLVPSVAALKSDADRGYVLIRRQADVSGPIEFLSADLTAALASPGSEHDPVLQNLDTATVFDSGSGRSAIVAPLLRQLRQQAVYGSPTREVEVAGMVHAPGTYPLEAGMRVSDLIRAGGSLNDSAYGLTAEIARYEVQGGSRRKVDLRPVDLAGVLSGDPAADLPLEPFDQLTIRQISDWQRRGSVRIDGEVRFPGVYPIEAGETLSNVIRRAGGLTEYAFAEGSVFLREDLKERERELIARLIIRLESDLAIMMLQANRAAAIQGARSAPEQSMAVGQSILGQLRRADPLGRLVIDLPALLGGDKNAEVLLRDGDRLHVPEQKQEVMVLGEVQHATSHLMRPGLRRDDYLAASGGLTVNGDQERTYVVRANGSVVGGGGGSRWFRSEQNLAMRPGDTIVVPLDVDRVPALALWQASTSILFNLAIAAAAIAGL